MKAKITLEIDGNLLREAKVIAAQEDMSDAAFLAQQLKQLVHSQKEKLKQEVRRRKDYLAARKRALVQLRNAKRLGWKKPASRDELHER